MILMSEMFGTLKVPETRVKSTKHGSEKTWKNDAFWAENGKMIEDDDIYHPAYYTVSNVWIIFTLVVTEERLCDKCNVSFSLGD